MLDTQKTEATAPATVTFTVLARALAPALSALAPIMSKEAYRTNICGMLLEVRGRIVRFVATDSYRLGYVDIALPENEPSSLSDGKWILPADAVKSIAAACKAATKSVRDALVAVEITAGKVHTRIGESTAAYALVEGTYLDYVQVIPALPTEAATCIGVNPTYLAHLATWSKALDVEGVKMRCSDAMTPVRFEATTRISDTDTEAVLIIMPMRI